MGRGRKGGFGQGRRLDKKEGVGREVLGLGRDLVSWEEGTGKEGQEEESGGIIEVAREGSCLEGEIGQEGGRGQEREVSWEDKNESLDSIEEIEDSREEILDLTEERATEFAAFPREISISSQSV